ncbi:hypothetical protein SAMN00777080_5103 [Aquiflexum balticum DSM 16537]|uniref:Uncharacterized protein n=1 Tax=Aquiflexum balticum DSM 16537 TaxID=758820 RepID=A0A1W2HBZ9_9BACT|nr:hypothetical protein [Aquiflexum balticum]SMD46413.1 hypothetical protein SAMN00777080_5103 [Aquiflexum balticum DSM 16537]
MKVTKKRRELEKDLLFYLRYYKKIAPDSRKTFNKIIEDLVELLKET